MTLGNVIYVFCFVFKSCFRITRWVGNKFQVFFSRKENCNKISFTCVKSRECISSWFSLKHVDSSDMTLNRKSCVRRSPAGATCSFSPGACWSLEEAPGWQKNSQAYPWRHDAANHEYSWGGRGNSMARHGHILQKVIGQSGHAMWAEMLLTPSKPSWGPCQCSGAAGRWGACTRKHAFVYIPSTPFLSSSEFSWTHPWHPDFRG